MHDFHENTKINEALCYWKLTQLMYFCRLSNNVGCSLLVNKQNQVKTDLHIISSRREQYRAILQNLVGKGKPYVFMHSLIAGLICICGRMHNNPNGDIISIKNEILHSWVGPTVGLQVRLWEKIDACILAPTRLCVSLLWLFFTLDVKPNLVNKLFYRV